MRVFVAGATGAIGKRLLPLLKQAGHAVTGMTRSPGKAEAIRAQGAEPVVADALDAGAVLSAVEKAAPDAIIHELTALPQNLDFRKLAEQLALTNRLRTEGTDHLLQAARRTGVRRFVAQSFAGWPYAREGGPLKTEQDPLDPTPPAALRETLAAIRHVETVVPASSGMEGLVLRYGGFYGPGTSLSKDGAVVEEVRHRRIPIIGGGTGIWSFLHIDDAARATLAALERGSAGVYNVVDNEPAPVKDWLPALAAAVGARKPFHLPAWIARWIIGDHGVIWMTQIRGASNAKAKRELAWQPSWTSWREGFRSAL